MSSDGSGFQFPGALPQAGIGWAVGPPLRTAKIPLPPLATQQAIVAEIEAEQALVAANRKLITRFEQKIHATLTRIWGEDSDSANGAPPSQPGATIDFVR